jgi:anti-sigma factor RsiW
MLHLSEELTAYLDGILTPEEAATVAAHLAECAECRATLDDLRAIRSLLRTMPPHYPHPALLSRTLARLASVETRRTVPRWVIAAATAVAGIVLLLQLRVPTAPRTSRVSPLWYFQQQAVFAGAHPMADVTLTSYLSSVLPYEIFPEWPAAQKTR